MALCDGGYVDNEGIVTAVNWVDFLLRKKEIEIKKEKSSTKTDGSQGIDKKSNKKEVFRRILILRIEPNSAPDLNHPSPDGGLKCWFRWLVGPVEAIVNVRTASQSERGNLESDLAEAPLGDEKETPKQKSKSEPAAVKPSGKTIFQKSRTDRAQEWDRQVEDYLSEEAAWLKSAKEGDDQNSDETSSILTEKVLGYIARSDNLNKTEKIDQSVALSEKWLDQKVIVVRVPFPDIGQTPPLNWKLSHKQKAWYRLAIKQLFADEGQGKFDKANEKDLPTAKLDRLFKRKR